MVEVAGVVPSAATRPGSAERRTGPPKVRRPERPIFAEQMVEVAGVEPASLVLSYGASTCLALNLLSSLNRL